MSENCVTAVEINQESCSKCSICYSVCPFEAIKRDIETGKVEIDQQKCQVCGICYSACPAMAIKTVYYDYDSLLNMVKKMHEDSKSDMLVLMCRGSSPFSGEVTDILKEHGIEAKNYIHLRLPCAGRIPAEFVFKVLNAGIKRVVSIQCEDDFCRFKEGSRINTRRMLLSQKLFDYLGLGKDAYTVIKHARKVVYDTAKCVGCDKCIFICPYGALEFESFATPKVIEEKCVGCGACQLVCPHDAIQVKGFEFDEVVDRYGKSLEQLKTNGKGPAVLAFVCQWSEFSALDNPNKAFEGKNVLTLEVPCFKSLDPVHIINALNCGFDGVMGVVCSSKDCKLQEGRDTAERNITALKVALKKLGLLNRFELYEESPRCPSDFEQKLDEFYKKISVLANREVTVEATAIRTK
jgi:coenzyme F420-reducing hydrogenase delta subunit/formate hydrogenlyase subunit 6/NADH:ubiquinone oxidoreductase subunit I